MKHPPEVPRRLLRLLAPRELVEPLEGDLLEGWERRKERPLRARAWYWWQVLTMPYSALHRRSRRLRTRPGETVGTGGLAAAWRRDLGLALRTLMKRPGFPGLVIPTLALSIGAATLLFSVTEGVLLRPLPYEDPEDLVSIYLENEEWRDSPNEFLRANWNNYTMSLRHLEAWRRAPTGLEGAGAFTYRFLELSVGGSPERARAILVDEGVFAVLGVQPEMGRLPGAPELAAGDRVAVLSHDTWVRAFAGDPDVLGRSFRLGDEGYAVIGVMPRGFFFPDPEADLWTPIPQEDRGRLGFNAVGRLADGTTHLEAGEALERVARRLGDEDPALSGLGARAVPHLDVVVGRAEGGIWLLFATALVVVLVACLNVANLTLARSAARESELAVRTALGASRSSVVRTVFAEVLLVCVLGGALGGALSAGLLKPFVAALETSVNGGLPRADEIGLNLPVLLFALAATGITASLSGIIPAIRAARRAPAQVLERTRGTPRSAGPGGSRRWLLAAQGGMAVVLFVAAGLLARSFLRVMSRDPGYDPARVAYLRVDLDPAGEGSPDQALSLLEETLRALPDVETVALASGMPESGGLGMRRLRLPEAPEADASLVATVDVSGDYFAAMGLPLLKGRPPATSSGDGPVEAALSEELARSYFPRGDPLGRSLVQERGGTRRELRVVGVVAESRHFSLVREPVPMVFTTGDVASRGTVAVLLKARGDPASVVDPARAAILGSPRGAQVVEAGTMSSAMAESAKHLKVRTVLIGGLAALAGVLAMVGVWGVVAQFLAGQTREVGIRMALGARPRREVARIVGHALLPTSLGLMVGTGAAVALSRLLESFLYDVPPTDPVAYAGAAGGLLLLATLAAWIPARRTASVDPARVLDEG